MIRRRPKLFIIRAMVSGTTSPARCLAVHTQVFFSTPKERMYCSRTGDALHGLNAHHELFAAANDEAYVTEASIEYSGRLFRDGVAKGIHRACPDARFVYIMRDPFERIVSQHKHMVLRHNEKRTLGEVLRSRTDYLTNSHYLYQLQPYWQKFGKQSVWLGTTEGLQRDPEAVLRELHGWLGIDASFLPDELGMRFHETPSSAAVVNRDRWTSRLFHRMRRSPIVRRCTTPSLKSWTRSQLAHEVDFESHEFRSAIDAARPTLQPLRSECVSEPLEATGRKFGSWSSAASPATGATGSVTRNGYRLPDRLSRTHVGDTVPSRLAPHAGQHGIVMPCPST